MSLTERAYRKRKWRGMEILPNLLDGKRIEAEKYLSSADYHPTERIADLIEIALLTAENIESFPLDMDAEAAERLEYEIMIVCKILGDASDYIGELCSDINRQSSEWVGRWQKRSMG